jgi:hypothetical protein
VAFLLLTFFIFAGSLLLKRLGIAISAFQISGSILLFLLGLSMVHGSSQLSAGPNNEGPFALAVYPMAIPVIAGPGSMLTVVLLADDDRHSVIEQFENRRGGRRPDPDRAGDAARCQPDIPDHRIIRHRHHRSCHGRPAGSASSEYRAERARKLARLAETVTGRPRLSKSLPSNAGWVLTPLPSFPRASSVPN